MQRKFMGPKPGRTPRPRDPSFRGVVAAARHSSLRSNGHGFGVDVWFIKFDLGSTNGRSGSGVGVGSIRGRSGLDLGAVTHAGVRRCLCSAWPSVTQSGDLVAGAPARDAREHA